MRENVPVVLGIDPNGGSFRSTSGTPLVHGIGDLPQVWCDFRLLPLSPVVIPLVTSADFHPRIALALVLFELVVRDAELALWLACRSLRRAALYGHGSPVLP